MTTVRSLAATPRLALLALGLAAMLAPHARGDDAPAKPRALFDGKSLDGWKKTDLYKPGEVLVEDGAIVMKAGSPMTGVTYARDDLPKVDYELVYEAMRLDGKDFFAAATFPVASSFITLVNGGWGGTVTGLSSLNGADASENETNQYVEYKDKTWHRFRVRVTAKAIRCWIDDKEVVAVVHEDVEVKTRLETRANQPLGFATWHTSGAVRKVAVRPLSKAEVAEVDKFEDK